MNQKEEILIFKSLMFINAFLDINNFLSKKRKNNYVWLNPEKDFYIMKNLYLECDDNIPVMHIIEMDYKKFLITPYWRIISNYVKYSSNNKCFLCNSSFNLNTHHKTYENHGREVVHLEDLICLCKKCHSKFHEVK